MNKVTFRPFVFACAAFLPLLAACSGAPDDAAQNEATTSEDALSASRIAEDANRISVSIAAEAAAVAASDAALVKVTLANRSNRTVHVLRWTTPVDGLHEPLFDISQNGLPVDYIGRHYKRAAPTAQSYLRLGPGESLSQTVDLAEAYDLSATGDYSIRHRGLGAPADGSEAALAAGGGDSNELRLRIEGRAAALGEAAPETGVNELGSTSYSGGCTSSEKTSIVNALKSASTYANNAYTYLSGTPGSKPRYTTWFGKYSSTNWSTAKSHFANIKNAIDTKNYVVDCSCNEADTFAYVYPGSPYKVYVCGAFWQAGTTGTDSKAGTLIHETSHFTVIAGTDDHVYGQSSAKRLASSNPKQALDNADNHEYFAENTPAQN